MHKIGFLLAEGFQLLALSTPSVFEFANLVIGEPFYVLETWSEQGGAVRSSAGVTVSSQPLSDVARADTWLVGGVINPLEAPASAAVAAFLRAAPGHSRRIAGICTGAFVLGDAGLLDGKRVTTHWAHAQALEARVPQARVESDRIFITDGAVWTSAGMTAGLDMALGMVEKDLGAEVARAVAHRLVMHHRRSGGQTQHSEMLALSPRSDRIQSALEYARKNLSRALTVDELADVVHLSPRQFSRLFREETGKSPAKAIEGLRLEAARLMIEQSRLSMDAIAREAGFRDRRHMREVFVRGFGVPPQALRQGRSSSRAA
ncbi:GlxA family transcriptional regulator [Cronobacter turicensis]|jgi:transcriptional regulator GlxA family with amidase domain|uniref:GlxA family transcriptional regulator n=1 Tax=Cronobacter TaxID=413496 RepID=UPI000CFD85DC|nr:MULTISPECIES: GlxA family transcriptional regulator [Cronobacter]MEB8539446.1 GlxA family transcriptional regulator [Cronobacter sakazakii]EGT4493119.1 GlxA family transcriptional regulator [Cronobacter turicensis]EKM0438289.1 GlxA family transcriptional regulator [Cronobacter turicensis]EKM0525807.1 GlxA family transcriptional regulator [Cronobacter turicensis]EKY3197009.1 GlxA family transcriptional regulator [Cronobacter turicensis]